MPSLINVNFASFNVPGDGRKGKGEKGTDCGNRDRTTPAGGAGSAVEGGGGGRCGRDQEGEYGHPTKTQAHHHESGCFCEA